MTDTQEIALGLNEIFSHRESFVVVALTGRTGSGCSTITKLLSEPNFRKIEQPELPFPPANQEQRKDRIVFNWLESHWHPFQPIQVSHVILLLALSESQEEFSKYVQELAPQGNLEGIKAKLSSDYQKSKDAYGILRSLRTATDDQVHETYSHIFDRLPVISSSIKKCLNNSKEKAYTKVFQALGDNVRRSGSALSSQIDPSRLLVLPETIAQIIKLARLRNRIQGQKYNYFVIDALRHPFESRYLRERISPFYAIAVSTDETSRKTRLTDLDFRKEEIQALDEKEYPSEMEKPPEGYSKFISQNIQACLETADIYIRNIGTPDKKDLRDLARQVFRYISLMQHPGIVTPTSIERCMHVAFSAKLNSGCISRQVGAVVTDEHYSIKSVGWNDVPQGQVPCLLRNTVHALAKKDEHSYSNFEKNDDLFLRHLKKTKMGKIGKEGKEAIEGRNNTYCFKTVYNKIKKDKNQVHTRSLHAEENAFLQISKYGGQGLTGGCLFTTASPCELCAKKAYQIGIQKIFYIDPYPGISFDHIISSGANPPELILFSGAIGRAYHELYGPVMPYKDELERIVIAEQEGGEQADLDI